jgi:hypothetical protein
MGVLDRVLQRLDSIFSVDPSLARIPPEVRQAAIRLLNRVTNGVDLLLSLRPTAKGWTARFLENGKPVEATWDGRELVTVLLSDLVAPGYRRDARKNCVKGRWCVGKTGRGTCIAAYKKCRQELKEQEMAAADRLSEALRQAAAAAPKQQAPKGTTAAAPARQTQTQQAPRMTQSPTSTSTQTRSQQTSRSPSSYTERDWGIERDPWMDEVARELRVPPALVENVFRTAEAMGGRYYLVYLNEFRKRFPDVPRELLDDVLWAMHRQAKIVLMYLDDPLSVTPEIREAAIKNPWFPDGSHDYHVLRVRN